jgi:hypothetical protein
MFDERQASVVSFGSPFSCHATEKTLADIFNLEPYKSPLLDRDRLLPLYFVWPGLKNKQNVKNSSFLLERRNISRLYERDSALMQNLTRCDRGIIVGDRWYASERVGQSHGLFVAQRQSGNCIYAAIIGAYGPDTYAVADCLAGGKINASLPPHDGKEAQPVFIAVVQTRTEERPRDSAKRETRTISSSSRVCESGLWEQVKTGSWVCQSTDSTATG